MTSFITGAALLTLVGCGGGGSSSTTSSSTTTTVAESEQVSITEENAAVVTVESIGALKGVGESLPQGDMMDMGGMTKILTKSAMISKQNIGDPSKLMAANSDLSALCSGGGQLTQVSNSSTSVSWVYNECKMNDDTTINGEVVMGFNQSQTEYTFEWKNYSETGTDFNGFEYTSYSYQTSSTKMIMNIEGLTDGEVTQEDAYAFLYNYTYQVADAQYSYGDFKAEYKGLNIVMAEENGIFSMSMNGYIYTSCLGSWIEYTTITPLQVDENDDSVDCPIAGEFKIGGNGSEIGIKFNSDQSIDVTLNGSAYQHYNNCSDLPETDEGSCAM